MTSYYVQCPHEGCDWRGSLFPSHLRGVDGVEVGTADRAWFRCPDCRRDWEARIDGDRVTVLPAFEQGG